MSGTEAFIENNFPKIFLMAVSHYFKLLHQHKARGVNTIYGTQVTLMPNNATGYAGGGKTLGNKVNEYCLLCSGKRYSTFWFSFSLHVEKKDRELRQQEFKRQTGTL